MKLSKSKFQSGSLTSLKPIPTPEQSFKMCKKIAQLTKVVAYLHSKQSDFDTILQSTIESYEHEIFLVIKDAKNRIQVLEEGNNGLKEEFNLANQVLICIIIIILRKMIYKLNLSRMNSLEFNRTSQLIINNIKEI